MIDDDQLRQYLISHIQDSGPAPGVHLKDYEIIQLVEQGEFSSGNREAQDREVMHAHLAECRTCIAKFRDVRDFFEPVRAGEEESREATVAWLRLRKRLGLPPVVAPIVAPIVAPVIAPLKAPAIPKGPSIGLWRQRRFSIALPAALAAGLLLALLVGAIWIVQLKGNQREMEARVQTDHQSYQNKLDAAEQETTRLKEQANQTGKDYEARLQEERQRAKSEKEAYTAQVEKAGANATHPGQGALALANVPIFDVFSDESVQRSGAKRSNNVKASAGTDRLLLILNGGGQADFTSYSIELADSAGKILWQTNTAKRDPNGSFSLMLSRGIAPAGSYIIRLFGVSSGTRQPIGQYPIAITY